MARQPSVEFAGNKRLLWIAEEWIRYAPELAEWAMDRIVNRRDVWSQYTIKNDRISVVMLPIKERRKLGTDMVTLTKLERHFSGRSPAHLIGLHSISDHSTCKWFAIDIDLHDENVPNADEVIEANKAALFAWAGKLRDMGMDPLVMDSNGEGGFHIWVLLDDEYPLADTFDLVDEIRSDWEDYDLPRKPEVFPPKREVGPDDLPYTLRLAGRHHTRPHYTRVYNFDLPDKNEWLEGGDAIEAMMAARPSKLPKTKKKRPPSRLRDVAPKKKKTAATQRPRVCVDLDGVLATYDGWKGFDHIGPPVPGALDFARNLAKVSDIVVFTSRCSGDPGPEGDIPLLTTGQMRIKIIEWLESHKFPYTDVYVGKGKPRVAAFIDDRAVNCSPQADTEAFDTALDSVYKILGRKPRTK
ncbi:MAG: hypothetical protein AB7J13_15995 [Pyrinomonadaceae bacterium]